MNDQHEKHSKLLIAALLTLFTILMLRTAWIADDAMITLRTVRNFVDGYGLVWNVGERVQSFTHPLWFFLLTPTYWLTREFFYSIIVLNGAVSLLAVTLFATKLCTNWRAASLTLLMLTLSVSFVDYATSGLENGLTHLLLVLFFYVVLRLAAGRRRLLWASLLLSLVFLNRSDMILIILPSYLLLLWQARGWRQWPVVALGAVPSVGWLLFALFYFGFPFPNTAYAKLNATAPKAEQLHQGILYLLDSVATDPLILFAVVLAAVVVFGRKQATLTAAFVGILLYLLYITYIGGDFMAGRFLTAPLLMACIIVGQANVDSLPRGGFAGLVGLVGFVGLLALLSPVTLDSRFVAGGEGTVPPNTIANERAFYFANQGLPTSTRHNRREIQGDYLQFSDGVRVGCGALGRSGLLSSANVYYIDRCGLGDPLMARLPPIYNVGWRSGHLDRDIPAGYGNSRRVGENQIEDPLLAEYYDHLTLITQAPLLAPNRLRTIFNMNLGRYNHLIDREAYVFPDVETLPIDMLRGEASPNLPPLGIKVAFIELIQAERLLLNYSGDRLRLRFFDGDTLIDSADLFEAPTVLLGQPYHVVAIPRDAQTGFTQIHVLPLTHEPLEPRLADLVPLVGVEDARAATLPLEQQLIVYHTHFLRARSQRDQQRLSVLETALLAHDAAEWHALGETKPQLFIELLRNLRSSELRTRLRQHLNLNVVLVDEQDERAFQLVAYELNSAEANDDANDQFALRLYVEPLQSITQPYTVWVHVESEADGTLQFYDQALPDEARRWEIGTIYTLEWALSVPQGSGRHKLSLGFWDTANDVRLKSLANDSAWTNLPSLISE